MLTNRLKILPADKAFKKTRTKDQDNVIVSPETGGYDISVFVKGQKVKTAWKSNKTSALQTARDLADFYRDENGQSLNIVTKDASPDMIEMYKQKFEEAIDNGDKEEMKRWFREIMNNVSFTDAGDATLLPNRPMEAGARYVELDYGVLWIPTVYQVGFGVKEIGGTRYPNKESAVKAAQKYIDTIKGSKDAESQSIGKHNNTPDDQFDADELAKGIKVEMEHTDDEAMAKAIAKDHLSEIPDYYTRLLKMEAEAKGE